MFLIRYCFRRGENKFEFAKIPNQNKFQIGAILNNFKSERKLFWTILKIEQKKVGEQKLFLNRFKN